jgi:hypothetical protein
MALLTAADEFRRAGRALPFQWDTRTLEKGGLECRCLGLRKLIEVKRAAGRPKDLQAIADLEALLEERGTKSAIVQEGKVGGRAGSHVYSPATRSQD